MHTLNFEKHFKTRWTESKQQFRAQFWDDIQQQLRGQVKQMLQDMTQMEFTGLIGASPYERSDARKTKRNGFYFRSLESPVGRIEAIQIPRARNMDIRFSIFDRWQQVDDGVLESMLQAYLLGRSSSCAQEIIHSFGHSRFSRGFLQRLTHSFEDNLQAWLNRPITQAWPYLFIDGMVVNVKEVHLQKWCVLWALGMDENHNTESLGFLVLKTESQEGCERLLRDLQRRGLQPPKLIISDDSKSIENAAAMVFPHTPQQGCSFHRVCSSLVVVTGRIHPFYLNEITQFMIRGSCNKNCVLLRIRQRDIKGYEFFIFVRQIRKKSGIEIAPSLKISKPVSPTADLIDK